MWQVLLEGKLQGTNKDDQDCNGPNDCAASDESTIQCGRPACSAPHDDDTTEDDVAAALHQGQQLAREGGPTLCRIGAPQDSQQVRTPDLPESRPRITGLATRHRRLDTCCHLTCYA
jgi:hypothetical protein